MKKSCNFRTLVFVAMVALLVLPITACAPKVSPPPPAGTLTVEPAKIDFEMLKQNFPPIAKALGLPEAMAATVPHLAMLAVPVKFTGSGWQPNEIITIDLVVPPDVEMKGLDRERGEDSVGIAFATTDDKGNFEAKLEKTAIIDFILRGGFTPSVAPDPKTLIPGNPLPNDTYTLRAMGEDTRAVATTTWDLQLVAPPAPPAEQPAEQPAAPPAAGELSFTADTFTNADYGYTIKYPKDWKRQAASEKDPVILYAVNVAAPVPVLSASVRTGATYSETVKASIEAAGGSSIKLGPEQEITLPGGNKAVKVKADWSTSTGFPGETLCVGVKQGDKWVGSGITTVAMFVPYDEAKFMEVLNTITVTK